MRRMTGPATVAFVAAIAFASSTPARAQCFSGCSLYVQGKCVEYRTCIPGPPPPPPPSYGAIAYGPKSRAWGDSYRWGSRAKAESVALQNCKQHGDDCEVAVWFDRRCGAVAAGEGTAYFWGIGRNGAQARAIAQKQCKDGGVKNCEIQVWRCSN